MAGDEIPLARYLAKTAPQGSSFRRPTEDDREANGTDSIPAEPDVIAPVWLMCPHCDEAFEPRFYRLCAWCGHDAGSGIVMEVVQHEPRNKRVTAVVLGLLLLTLLFFAYYGWLFYRPNF